MKNKWPQAELQKIYKENNVSMVWRNWLFVINSNAYLSLFFAARYTKGATQALGMNLGQPNMILVALAGLAYLAQGYISMIG